ncbi:hypothetical protein HGB13_00280 [bacterium]|nr:hypothetical protein [bacterium]
MKAKVTTAQELPVVVAGSCTFGRYPKISDEETTNMYVADNWLVPFPGYKCILDKEDFGYDSTDTVIFKKIYKSSKIFVSGLSDKTFYVVVNDKIFVFDSDYLDPIEITDGAHKLPSIDTKIYSIAENSSGQIIFCYGSEYDVIGVLTQHITGLPTFENVTTPYRFTNITYQDGYFIGVVKNSTEWRLALANELTTWPTSANFLSKADILQCCLPLPGKGSQLFLIGSSHIESWVNVGSSLFPYQRNTGYSIDYGCLSTESIAYGDEVVVWLGYSANMGPVIMYSDGGAAKSISTDGINYLLSTVTNFKYCNGFLYKDSGHLFYVLNNSADNPFTIAYDFSTDKFFFLTDENGDNYQVKDPVFNENGYFFLRERDDEQARPGGVYFMSSSLNTYGYIKDSAGFVIPKHRTCNHLRFSDSSTFIVNNLTFTIEQGNAEGTTLSPSVELTVSMDGGKTFSYKAISYMLNKASGLSKIMFWNLGYANDAVFRIDFISEGRVAATNGLASIIR